MRTGRCACWHAGSSSWGSSRRSSHARVAAQRLDHTPHLVLLELVRQLVQMGLAAQDELFLRFDHVVFGDRPGAVAPAGVPKADIGGEGRTGPVVLKERTGVVSHAPHLDLGADSRARHRCVYAFPAREGHHHPAPARWEVRFRARWVAALISLIPRSNCVSSPEVALTSYTPCSTRPPWRRCFLGHSPPDCSLVAPGQTNTSPGTLFFGTMPAPPT